jgi:hypothetical protein
VSNALSHVTVNAKLPEGVSQILDNNFLIDIHTCLPFFVLLVNTAKSYDLRIAVLAVDDATVLTDDLFQYHLVAGKGTD